MLVPGLCESWCLSKAPGATEPGSRVPLTHGDSARPPPQAACRGRGTDLRVTRGWALLSGPLPNRLPQSLFPLPRKRG